MFENKTGLKMLQCTDYHFKRKHHIYRSMHCFQSGNSLTILTAVAIKPSVTTSLAHPVNMAAGVFAHPAHNGAIFTPQTINTF